MEPQKRVRLLDLPDDILCEVLLCFQNRRLKAKGIIDWRMRPSTEDRIRHQTIQNTRRVCRRFNCLASPLLYSIVRVNLDQESLDNAVKILQHPLLASGVRGIEVGLCYRPTQLTTDSTAYKSHILNSLDELARDCELLVDHFPDSSKLESLLQDTPMSVFREAAHNAWKIRFAWINENVSDAQSFIYQEIFRRGYEEYCQKHKEQVQLIETGSFVNSLTSCICRLQNTPAFAFLDEPDRKYEPHNPTVALRDMDKLSQFVLKPQSWRVIESIDADADLLPARILFELPVALHKAGSPVHEIYVGCFPLHKSFSMILPPFQGPDAWSELRAACQALRAFSFGRSMNHRSIRHHHPQPDDQFHIDQYLGAMLSGVNLEFVYLCFYAFMLNDGTTTRDDFIRLGSVLRTLKLPRGRDITVMYVAMDQDELESVCRGLGYSLEHLYICGVHLESGTWAGMVDELREKVQHRCREACCQVRLCDFKGGGIMK